MADVVLLANVVLLAALLSAALTEPGECADSLPVVIE
jgi:hypothetical protein